MNKLFMTLFTLYLGILFFIPTFTANSADKNKEEKKITIEEVLALGEYQKFNSYPEGMLEEIKKCKKQFCIGKISGKNVNEIFVKRGPLWHERYPGKMIHGMAWFEIVYLENLRKTKKQIARYIKNGPDGYSSILKKKTDIKAIRSVINMNKGRKKMREALGLSLKDDLATVLKRHWLLGDLLNNDKYEVKRISLNKDLKKRKQLLEKYQAALKKYKDKLEEQKNIGGS